MAQTRQTHSSTKPASASKGATSKSSAKEAKDPKHEKPSAKAVEKKPEAKPAAKVAPPPAKTAPPAKVAPAVKGKDVAQAKVAPKVAVKAEPERPAKAAAAEPVAPPRPPSKVDREPEAVRASTPVTMAKEQLEHFRKLLIEKRDDIIKKAKQTLDEDMTLDANDLPDEMDLASSEYLQSFTFRLRGREKSFLDKINKALERLDGGNFGMCEECGEEISVKRLEARPETTLCIRCKEDQERAEKDYG
jgi:DnaK suppressor protein